MTEGFMRHFISIMAMLIVFLSFYAGYMAGKSLWWWAGLLSIIIYFVVYNILEV